MDLIYNTETLNWNPLYNKSPDSDSTDGEDQSFLIDVRPKKKQFVSHEEKKQYIEEYTKKKKTELCKNFVMTGRCKYGTECSFAHGADEIQPKTHLHYKYKTKPCKRFFKSGFCPYGIRCQYIHHELINKPQYDAFLISSYKELGIQPPISSKQLRPDMRNDLQRFILTMKNKNIDPELFITNRSRLQVFQSFAGLSNEILSDDSQKSYQSSYKKIQTSLI